MPFDIQGELNDCVWFNYGKAFTFKGLKDEKGKAIKPFTVQEKVKLRVVSPEYLQKIIEETQGEAEYKEVARGRFQFVNSPDPKMDRKRNEMIWDYSIADWELWDTEGKKIPCTKENKVKMMGGSPKFATFIGSCLSVLGSKYQQDKEKLEQKYKEELENL